MSVRARLAAFALALATVFAVGFGIGTIADDGTTGTEPLHEEHAP